MIWIVFAWEVAYTLSPSGGFLSWRNDRWTIALEKNFTCSLIISSNNSSFVYSRILCLLLSHYTFNTGQTCCHIFNIRLSEEERSSMPLSEALECEQYLSHLQLPGNLGSKGLIYAAIKNTVMWKLLFFVVPPFSFSLQKVGN